MKRMLIILASLLVLTSGSALATPINDLGNGQTAVGLGSDTFYLEHKLSDSFTLGLANIDWAGQPTDIYGQFDLSGNLRAVVGSRGFDGGSKLYAGLAVNGPLGPGWDGYASLVGGSGFNELQVGANVRLSHNVDLNIGYHSFSPDLGRSHSGLGAGVTFKF